MKLDVEIENMTLGQLIEASKTYNGRTMLKNELHELEATAKRMREALQHNAKPPQE